MARKILVVLLLLEIINKGTPLKCYKCSTNKDESNACTVLANGVDLVTTQDCATGQVCAVYTVKNPATGSQKISRSCAHEDICAVLRGNETDYSQLTDCRVCLTDLCDSGRAIGASASTLLLSLILGRFIG